MKKSVRQFEAVSGQNTSSSQSNANTSRPIPDAFAQYVVSPAVIKARNMERFNIAKQQRKSEGSHKSTRRDCDFEEPTNETDCLSIAKNEPTRTGLTYWIPNEAAGFSSKDNDGHVYAIVGMSGPNYNSQRHWSASQPVLLQATSSKNARYQLISILIVRVNKSSRFDDFKISQIYFAEASNFKLPSLYGRISDGSVTKLQNTPLVRKALA